MSASRGKLMRCFLRSCSGGAAVELAMVFPLLLLLTFGIIEFGLVMNQVNMAEKATQIGARKAVTWDPVAPALATYTGISGSLGGGDPLPVGLQVDITCDSDGCTGAGAITSPGFSSTAFADIVDEMAAIYPAIEAENVVIEYHHVGLGFVGRPGGAVVPSVTVSLRDLTYDFILLDVAVTIASAGLVDINNLLYPSFSTTLTGEDLSDGA